LTVGETILKFTDYPFAYSLIAILLHVGGIGIFPEGTNIISEESILFLALAGTIGTTLAITDPLGRAVKHYSLWIQKISFNFYKNPEYENTLLFKFFSKVVRKMKEKPRISSKWEDIESAHHTKAIEIEKEKIVSSLYFLFLIVLTNYVISYTDIIEKNLSKELAEILCSADCIKSITEPSLFLLSFILAFVIAWNGSFIIPRAKIVSTYLMATTTPKVTKTSNENLSRFIESGDWKTAQYWKGVVEIEFLEESGLKDVRDKNLNQHITKILSEFREYHNANKTNNINIMLDSGVANNPEKTKSVEEIFKKFNWYDSLMEHLYSVNHVIYQKFRRYLELEKKLSEDNITWDEEKRGGINSIVQNLKFRKDTIKLDWIYGENGQTINLALIRYDLDDFLITDREELIPIRSVPDGTKWEVRFFDSELGGIRRNDVVAVLNKDDAEKLSVELAHFTNHLRNSSKFAQSDYGKWSKIQDELDDEIDSMFKSDSLHGKPLLGSCLYCRNSEFFSEYQIKEDVKKMNEFPKDLLSKEKILSSPSRRKVNKAPIKNAD